LRLSLPKWIIKFRFRFLIAPSVLPPMSAQGSITGLIGLLKDGDHDAAQRVWEVYFERMANVARSRLRAAPRRTADEENAETSP
jgi:hypothetical protein